MRSIYPGTPTDPSTSASYYLFIPYWAILIPTAIFPVVWTIRRRHQSMRSTMGLCANRGYDLRAAKDICPECGVNIESLGWREVGVPNVE